MQAILDGLPQSVKENIEKCISAKELQVKLENLYSVEEIPEPIPTVLKYEGYTMAKAGIDFLE